MLVSVSFAKAEVEPVVVKINSISEGQVFEQNSFKFVYTAQNATTCVYVINDGEKVELPNCEYTEVKLDNGEYKLTLMGYNEKFSQEASVKFVVNYTEPVIVVEEPTEDPVEEPVITPVVIKHSSSGSYVRPTVTPVLALTPDPGKVLGAEKFVFTLFLKKGLKGSEVAELQKFLNANGFTVSLSGAGSLGKETTLFGAKTKLALIKFQIANGLKGDGVVGDLTRAVLNK